MRLLPHDAWLALPVAWAAFFAVGRSIKLAMRALPSAPAWAPHAAFKGAILVLSFAAASVEGISPAAMGCRPPTVPILGPAIGAGLLLGAVGTLVMLLGGLQGLRKAIGGQSFLSIVLGVWLLSSIAEEVFCRGWVQTSTLDGGSTALAALLPSAVLFGSLHLGMLFAGVDGASVAVIVVSTALLGALAAWARAVSGSLLPAVVAHIAFNVGGALGGIAYAGVYRTVTGRMPFQKH